MEAGLLENRTLHWWEELWTFWRFRAQKERIIGHYPNDRSHTRTRQEAALPSISSAFLVTELLMTYKKEGWGAACCPSGQHVHEASNYSQESADSFLHLETRFAGAN